MTVKKPKKPRVKKSDINMTSVVPKEPRQGERQNRFQFDANVLRTIESLAGYGLTQKQICDYLGISVDTFQSRNREMPEIGQAMWSGKAKAIGTVSQAAFNMAASGKSAEMTKFFLKAKAGWKETERLQLAGDEAAPIVHEHRAIDTSKLSTDEKRILLKGLKKQQEGK